MAGNFWLQESDARNSQTWNTITHHTLHGSGALRPRQPHHRGDALLLWGEYGVFSIAKVTLPHRIPEVSVLQIRENAKLSYCIIDWNAKERPLLINLVMG